MATSSYPQNAALAAASTVNVLIGRLHVDIIECRQTADRQNQAHALKLFNRLDELCCALGDKSRELWHILAQHS